MPAQGFDMDLNRYSEAYLGIEPKARLTQTPEKNSRLHRFTLDANQWVQLPQEIVTIRVLSGAAWFITERQDSVLRSGQEWVIPFLNYPCFISGIDQIGVVLEVESDTCPRQLG